MNQCARCDWQPDRDAEQASRAQLAEHAEQAGHPLCAVCHTSLVQGETQTCERCLDRAQTHLAGVAFMYDELPSHLGQGSGAATGPVTSDGRPLPGGEILVLLGPGSQGLSEDGTTTRDDDTTSVAYELGWWEADWRERRGEVAVTPPRRLAAEVRAYLGYLETRMRWAATTHPGFGRFAEDIRVLHSRLERATGRAQLVVKAEAECFRCGADALVREVQPGESCKHRPPLFPPEVVIPLLPISLEVRRARFAELVEEYERQHGRCQQGGYVDHWTCQRCGERYDWRRYVLACSARVEAGRETIRAAGGWGTPVQVAAAVGVPFETLRTWTKRLQVTSCCLVESKQQLVWYPDADKRAAGRRQSMPGRCA